VKIKFCHICSPCKNILPTSGKSTIGPSLEKNLLVLMFRGTCSSVEMLKRYTDGESLGTPVLSVATGQVCT